MRRRALDELPTDKRRLNGTDDSKSTTKREKNGEDITSEDNSAMVYYVFISLILDLLAFTMILPLFPSLLDHYRLHDDPDGLYPWLLKQIKLFQLMTGTPDRFSSVLFGGFLGSMFSFLQFLASPLIGGISDAYGRKPVMIGCLIGIASSYVLWALSNNFALFVLARIIGGISKGNVSLSLAIVSDVSTPQTRGRGMALVGVAFSIGFIIGPVIGAAFAHWSHGQTGNWHVVPASFALGLAALDIIFVVLFLKETLPKVNRAESVVSSLNQAVAFINVVDLFKFRAVKEIKKEDQDSLCWLGYVYFIYLFLYSGLEFTLTFLTHHKFNYTSMQQGWMFFAIGLTMAIMQGSYVRRIPEHKMARTTITGLFLIIPSFICVGLATSPFLLYVGLLLFAISTAMVVPCITTLVSKFGSTNQKGTVMGIFRSLGALARAVGPIIASVAYWSIGSTPTYLVGGVLLIIPWLMLRKKYPRSAGHDMYFKESK